MTDSKSSVSLQRLRVGWSSLFLVLLCCAAVLLYNSMVFSRQIPYEGALAKFGAIVNVLVAIGMPLGIVLSLWAWRTWQAKLSLLCALLSVGGYLAWMSKYLFIFDISPGH